MRLVMLLGLVALAAAYQPGRSNGPKLMCAPKQAAVKPPEHQRILREGREVYGENSREKDPCEYPDGDRVQHVATNTGSFMFVSNLQQRRNPLDRLHGYCGPPGMCLQESSIPSKDLPLTTRGRKSLLSDKCRELRSLMDRTGRRALVRTDDVLIRLK